MNIRTTNLSTTNSMLNYIQDSQSRYFEIMQQGASGKKVTEPSDDPIATKNILNVNAKLDQLNNYLTNMSTAQTELNTLDDALASLVDSIQDASDLATQAANGTYGSSSTDGFKSQIDQILENVIDIANTKYNGKYIFSGNATATEAYSITKDASGNITAVTYNGTAATGDYERKVTISDGVSVGINEAGENVFGYYKAAVEDDPTTVGVDESQPEEAVGLIGTLVKLSNSVASDDKDGIKASLDELSTAIDTTSATRTKFASVSSRFDLTTSSINTTVMNLKEYRSDLQDIDLAEVATDLATQQLALEATMSITSSMLTEKTLLDYI